MKVATVFVLMFCLVLVNYVHPRGTQTHRNRGNPDEFYSDPKSQSDVISKLRTRAVQPTSDVISKLRARAVQPASDVISKLRAAHTDAAAMPDVNQRINECVNDCWAYRSLGYNSSAIMTMESENGECDRDVYCDMETDGGGWTVFQRHQSDAVNFNRSWADYKNGFGPLDGDFWWGNEKLAQALNDGRQYELRIDLFDWHGEHRYAKYSHFHVTTEFDNFTLSIDVYTGDAGGDSFDHHNGEQFSTFDRDNERFRGNCAKWKGGGFWFHYHCFNFFPNGGYSHDEWVTARSGIVWPAWHGWGYSLKAVEMKFRARLVCEWHVETADN